MENVPVPAIDRALARELDRRAIEDLGIPSLVLMENAGRACAQVALQRDLSGGVLVLCGPGNNGADGIVLARTLKNHRVEVEVVFVGPEEKLRSSSEELCFQVELWGRLGQEIGVVSNRSQALALAPGLEARGLVVDALFGTGLCRTLGEPWTSVVQAVDLPSGLDADTGQALGALVRAAVTVTFVAPKVGMGLGDGPRACGEVQVAEIGIPLP